MNQPEFNELLNRMVILFESGPEMGGRTLRLLDDQRHDTMVEQSRKLVPLLQDFLESSCLTKKYTNSFTVSDQESIAELVSVFSTFREIKNLDDSHAIFSKIFEETKSPTAKATMDRIEDMICRSGNNLFLRIDAISELLLAVVHKFISGYFPEPEDVRSIIEKHEKLQRIRWGEDVESFDVELKPKRPGIVGAPTRDNPKFPMNYPVTFFSPGDKIIKNIPRFVQTIIDETGSARKQTRYETGPEESEESEPVPEEPD